MSIQDVIDSLQTISQSTYANEGELVDNIISIVEAKGWYVVGKEWGVLGFPELGAGDVAFQHHDNQQVACVIEAKLVKHIHTKQEKVREQAAYYGRMWSRMHPGIYVFAIACSEIKAEYVPISSEYDFVHMAATRLYYSHTNVQM